MKKIEGGRKFWIKNQTNAVVARKFTFHKIGIVALPPLKILRVQPIQSKIIRIRGIYALKYVMHR